METIINEDVFDWREHWRGMPEFISDNLSSERIIHVHFRNNEDVQRFAELMNQRITPKQKYIWFPEMPKVEMKHLRYLEADE